MFAAAMWAVFLGCVHDSISLPIFILCAYFGSLTNTIIAFIRMAMVEASC